VRPNDPSRPPPVQFNQLVDVVHEAAKAFGSEKMTAAFWRITPLRSSLETRLLYQCRVRSRIRTAGYDVVTHALTRHLAARLAC